jgi:hypothetical protein
LVNPLLFGRLERWRAIDVGSVATAMRAAALSGRRGVHRHSYAAIRQLARDVPAAARL